VDALGERRLDETIDVAIKHGRRVGAFDAGPQILHQLVGLQHVRPDLMAEADVGLGGGGGLRLLFSALQLGLVERARSIAQAVARFLCCDRSFWHVTTIPVGKWVMRTALSVVLTCWPPAPDER